MNKGNRLYIFCILCMFGIFHVSILRVCAKEEALGPLIQTTTPEEEYMGLVHLGLLKTEDNYSGNTSQSIRNVLPTVVQLRTGNLLGSGMILEIGEDTALIVSNRHQLAGQEFSVVRFYNGAEVSGRRIYLSGEYDLGFVLADISQISFERRSQLRNVSIKGSCNEKLERGTEIFLVGSTDGVACNICEGMVADPWYYFDEFGSYMIYNYCKAKAGMSGGGTYDEHGHCVGMITGGHDEETASLPVQNILEEWNKLESQGLLP